MKFHFNHSDGSRSLVYGEKDEETDMKFVTVTFTICFRKHLTL